MKIIQQYSIGKRANLPSEDGWVMTDHFAAVVDGSTAKIPLQPGEESPGHLAMRLVCDAIKNLPPEADKDETISILSRTIAADTTYKEKNYRPTCSAVIYSRYHQQVWFIGDCQARWTGKSYTFEKLVDKILINIRCRIISYYLDHGYTEEDIRKSDKGRAFIYDALRDQVNFQNDKNLKNPYRYTVLDGQYIDPETVPCYSMANVKELILASDGYPKLFDTLEETENYLTSVLKKDPLCIRENPATKCLVKGNRSFDDRTYLKIEI